MREYKPAEYMYKDFKVCVQKEASLDGWGMIYYQIYDKDGVEVISAFTEDSTPHRKYAMGLKELVDDIIENPEDYYDEES
jgi:hypothetical protein